MRRIVILLAITLFCFSTAALAGDSAISALGVKGGITRATYSGDDYDYAFSTGGVFGGYMVIKLVNDLSMQSEVLYIAKGSVINYREPEYNYLVKYTDKLSYLEIPVLLKYTVVTKGNIQPHFFAGPAISILMNARETGRVSYAHASFDIKDDVNTFDYSLIVGTGINLKADRNWVTLDFRYELGRSEVFDKKYDLPSANRTFAFIAGFEF
jgi:hypothetical protein